MRELSSRMNTAKIRVSQGGVGGVAPLEKISKKGPR
jgi:hypothetical protein